jgi:hypothetical protein
MTDFGQLKVQKQETARFKFYDLVGEPTLIVKRADEANKPYFNEVLRRAEQLQKRKAKLSVDMIQEDRARDRELYVQHVIVGFGDDVVDAAGQKVPYNAANATAFIAQIEDEQFDDLRKFCRDASNFRIVNNGAAASGNSPTV